jgi:energy-coupling factor transport system ATP-binding protein
LKIKKGEFILITGESGSGKTSLARCINGLIPYFHEGKLDGSIKIMGKDTQEVSISSLGEMVGSVFQDPRSQFFTTNTTEEVAFGCTNMGLKREEIFSRIKKSFKKIGIGELEDHNIFKISSGEKQKVAIASCYAMDPDIYVFDEPSANLDVYSTLQLSEIMKELKCIGKTVIVLEHRLYYLSQLFDRMIFVEKGKICREYSNEGANALSDNLLRKMGLRNLNFKNMKVPTFKNKINSTKTIFEADNISFSYKTKRTKAPMNEIIQDLSFKTEGGEVIGIVGKNGAGKTTLSRLCCGLLKESGGRLKINGQIIKSMKRQGNVYFVMQDSDYQLFSDSVLRELTIGKGKNFDNKDKTKRILKELHLWGLREYHPASLSRGQKQRLTIASSIVSNANIIFFDEPTSGLDGCNMINVTKQLKELANNGKIVFVVTHDYEFLISVCTRVLHLMDGKIKDDYKLTNETRIKLEENLWERGVRD